MSMTEVIVEERPVKPKRPGKRLGVAAWIDNPVGSSTLYSDSILPSLSGENEPDKMEIPKEFHKRLALVRYYYELDPIANTAVDKIVEIAINGLIIDRGDCDDNELKIYESVRPFFEKYLMEATLEYLLSGLVVPMVTWESKAPRELGLNTLRKYKVPSEVWVLDPACIELKQIPLTPKVTVILRIPSELKAFLSNKGEVAGYKDIGLYKFLRDRYPEWFRAVQKGDSKIVLEDAFLIRRKAKTYDPYPTPFLLAALESLAFKRNLKKMDFSVASRVISAIQLVRLGSDEYPITEDDEDLLDDLQTKMLWRNRPKNIDRVFQLFANHTLNIEWIYPDTEAMLDQGKYDAVDKDIFYALGFPRILVSGETMRSATSQAEFAMFSPAETMKRLREQLLTWIHWLIDEIQESNNLKHKIAVRFEEIRLYDIEKLTNIAAALYENNALSLTSLANSAGYNFDDEVVMKSHDRDLMAEYKIPEFPPKPFSPKPDVTGEDDAKGISEN